MKVNVSQISSARLAVLSAFAGIQLGLLAATFCAWVTPNLMESLLDHAARNTTRISAYHLKESSNALHRSIMLQLRDDNERTEENVPDREDLTIDLVSNAIEGFGHDDDAARTLAEAIVQESNSAELDPLLVAAVVKYESSFRTRALSSKGARGLMQVMPATERALMKTVDLKSLTDHEKQLRLGAAYLAEMKKRFRGNLYHSLIAYNWGPTNLASALKSGAPLPSGPVKYAKRILAQRAVWNGEVLKQTTVG